MNITNITWYQNYQHQPSNFLTGCLAKGGLLPCTWWAQTQVEDFRIIRVNKKEEEKLKERQEGKAEMKMKIKRSSKVIKTPTEKQVSCLLLMFCLLFTSTLCSCLFWLLHIFRTTFLLLAYSQVLSWNPLPIPELTETQTAPVIPRAACNDLLQLPQHFRGSTKVKHSFQHIIQQGYRTSL